MATRRIDLVIALHDEFSEKLNRIQKMAGKVEASFSKTRRAAQMLDRQKIEPLMQIRDRLTAPAMKAQALVKRLDLQTAEPRVSLRDLVTGKAREIGGALRGLASHTWTVTIQAKDRVTDVARRITGALTSPLAMLGAGAGATAAIAFPLKLAGEMDRTRRSIELYSGSVEAGRKNFEELVNLAIKSPIYEVPFVVEQAGQLLAKGQNIDFAKRALNAFGNAAMYTGASLERLELAFYGFGQIASIGTLSMEELKQVTENLNVPLNWIAEELGITGDQLRDLGKAGIPAQQAMEAIVRTLEKRFPVRDFNNDLLALVSNVKEAARVVVWKFGEGIVQPVIRILQDMAGILDPTSEKFKQFQQEIIDAGLRVGEAFERAYSKLKKFFDGLSKNEAFQKMDWGDKVVYILDQMIQAIDNWVSGPGGKQVEKVFVKLAEIGARAWLTALGGLVKGAGESLLRGNILGGIGLLAGAGLLGGGMLVRGAWSVGKGALGLGSRILGRGTATGAGVAAEIAAGTAATASRGSRIMRVLHEWFVAPASKRALEPLKRTVIPAAPEQVFRYRGFISGAPEVEAFRIPGTATRAVGGGFAPLRYIGMFGKAGNIISRMALPLTFATGAVEIALARPEERVQTGLKVGGRIAGGLAGAALGAKAGAAIGTLIAPGLGTAIGGAVGGLGGGIAGAFGGEAIMRRLSGILDRVDFGSLKEKAISWIKALPGEIAEHLGYIAGYAVEKLSQLPGAFSEWFQQARDSAIQWVMGMPDQIAAFVESIPGRVSSAIESVKEAFLSLGKSIPEAIASGFNLAKERLGAAGKWIIEKAMGGIEAAKELGRRTAEGFEAGRRAAKTPVEAHALGGILTRPHLGLVAEAGPEAVIPLSARMRTRAKELWQRVGVILGTLPVVPDLASRTIISTELGALPAVPELTKKATVNPVIGALPKLPEMVGKALYQATAAVPNLPKIAGQGIARIIPQAEGGILTRPHLGLMAEAELEAVIPLSSRLRNRALDLWEKTGEYLGVKPYAFGGFTGPIPAVAGAMGGGGGNTTVVNIYLDGAVQNTITVNGREDIENIANEAAKIVANNIRKSLENRI